MDVFRTFILLTVLSTVLYGCSNMPFPARAVARQPIVAPALTRLDYRTAVKPPPGFIYANIKAPLNIRASGQSFGPKKGTATVRQIFLPYPYAIPLISWGDASVQKAADNGGIRDVEHADYAFWNLLVYREFTVEVYGK